jgi:hypothetical protein
MLPNFFKDGVCIKGHAYSELQLFFHWLPGRRGTNWGSFDFHLFSHHSTAEPQRRLPRKFERVFI